MTDSLLNSEKIIIKPEILKEEIVLTKEELEKERESFLKRLQRNVSIPGFRPGKVPMSILKKRYNADAFYEGFEQLLKNKTREILDDNQDEVLHYAYDFDNMSVIKDDNTDKHIGIEYLLKPRVDTRVKDKEIELVEYGFTENQKKICSDILILTNLLVDNPVDKLEVNNINIPFLLDCKLINTATSKSSSEDSRDDINAISLLINNYTYSSLGLNELLPGLIEKNQTYSINSKTWLDILQSKFGAEDQLSIIQFLKKMVDNNVEKLNIEINAINVYPDFGSYLDKNKIKFMYEIEEEGDITLDMVYAKTGEVIKWVEEYISGINNKNKGLKYILNIVEVDVPDDFIRKLYNNYYTKERENYPFDTFKREFLNQIKNNTITNLFPNTFNISIDTEQFITNVAKYIFVEKLLSEMAIMNINDTKLYVREMIEKLKSVKEPYADYILKSYYSKNDTFTFTQNLSKDIKVTIKKENINKIKFHLYFGLTESIFT